jgi:hypothetical protein
MTRICDKLKKFVGPDNSLVAAAVWYGIIVPVAVIGNPLEDINEERKIACIDPLTRMGLYRTLLTTPFEPIIGKAKNLLGTYLN